MGIYVDSFSFDDFFLLFRFCPLDIVCFSVPVIIIVGCLSFFIGVVQFALTKDASPDVMIYSTGVITIGAGLLGYRKSKDKIEIDLNESVAGLEEEEVG